MKQAFSYAIPTEPKTSPVISVFLSLLARKGLSSRPKVYQDPQQGLHHPRRLPLLQVLILPQGEHKVVGARPVAPGLPRIGVVRPSDPAEPQVVDLLQDTSPVVAEALDPHLG